MLIHEVLLIYIDGQRRRYREPEQARTVDVSVIALMESDGAHTFEVTDEIDNETGLEIYRETHA